MPTYTYETNLEKIDIKNTYIDSVIFFSKKFKWSAQFNELWWASKKLIAFILTKWI